MINISSELIEKINTDAEKEYPFECCGILFGNVENKKNKSIIEIMPLPNSRELSNKHNRFLITPDDIMKSELYARKNKMDVLGFYHSHPDHSAMPSDYDLTHAWPFYSYIIVSVILNKTHVFKSWELKHDRSKFDEEEINIIGG